MVRALTFTVSLALSLMIARPAAAAPVTPADLDTIDLGSPVGVPLADQFTSVLDPSRTVGTSQTRVFFDGDTYFYTQTVNPTGLVNFIFATDFAVSGFTGVAGWRYADATSAGGSGNAGDFDLMNVGGQLIWMASLGGSFGNWNAFEPITFFFASTNPPAVAKYNLFAIFPLDLGSAQGLAPAPVPEPGTIALFGSGLVALYSSLRRRGKLRT